MSTPQTLALDLSKINLSLHMRLLQLAQKNAQLWLGLGQRLLENNAASSDKAQDTLQGVTEWAQMAQLPGDTYWAQMLEALNNVQAAMQESISAQSKLGADAQNMLRDWQQQVLQSMGCLTSPAVDAQQAQQPSWQAAWAPLQGMFAAMQGGLQNAWQGMGAGGMGEAGNWMEQWQQMMANAMPNIPGLPQFGGQK